MVIDRDVQRICSAGKECGSWKIHHVNLAAASSPKERDGIGIAWLCAGLGSRIRSPPSLAGTVVKVTLPHRRAWQLSRA